jgi:peptidoglycan/LPS O-acetylase OafA/YrhL
MQPLWGLSFFIVINRVVSRESWWQFQADATKWVKWLTGLGLISYSLYLTHELVFHIEAGLPWFTVPVSVFVAWVFFQFFEKPFITSPSPRSANTALEYPPALASGALDA